MVTRNADPASEARGVISWYDAHAEQLADGYEGLDAAQTHPDLFAMLDGGPRLTILDVGAGTGRDAAALAALGHDVTAVEPSRKMLRLARALHPGLDIAWKCDALPNLVSLTGVYDLVLLSGVWMHVAPVDRSAAFDRLAALIAPGGRIYLTLRSGPEDISRAMWPTSITELRRLAAARNLTVDDLGRRPDFLGRDDVHWRTLLVRRL